MTNPELGFIYRFIPATKAGLPTLLLLHGTGGDENDLIPLGQKLMPGAALLSPRGKVLENGLPRYFRRLPGGLFDFADLKLRTAELAGFIAAARKAYDLPAPVALGFSNGANIAVSLLLTQPGVLAHAALIRAMLQFEPLSLPDLTTTRVLLLSGATDAIVPATSRDRLVAVLKQAGAAMTFEIVAGGHNLTQRDFILAADWLEHLK